MAENPGTLIEALSRSATRFADRPALRSSDGRVSLSWREYLRTVERLAAELQSLGLNKGDTFAILMPNRPEWQLFDSAAMWSGAIPVSLYASSPVELNIDVMSRSGATMIAIDESLYLKYASALPASVVVIEVGDDSIETLTDGRPRVPAVEVCSDDLATIIYTSGTTGKPKGVELTHGAIVFMITALGNMLSFEGGRTISYLPHAHIVDRVVGHYIPLIAGSSATDFPNPMAVFETLKDVRPTFFTSVPRIWSRLRDALVVQVASASGGAELLGRIESVISSEPFSPDGDIVEEMVPFLRSVGLDAVQWCVTGSAPLSEDVHRFFAAIGLPLHDVWGLSETVAVATAMAPGGWSLGDVGTPIPGTEVIIAADGEVLVRGPHIAKGYRDDVQATAESFDEEGWFHTGDIGQWTTGGRLALVDRKKEMIISSGGENMSPTRIEGVLLSTSSEVQQVMVIGDGKPYNVALIVPTFDATSIGETETRQRIALAVDEANTRLSRAERIRDFAVLPSAWTAATGELTPTFKLRRKATEEKYKDLVGALYGQAI